jgi:2-oxoglutarate ferredoxin oxidoreductase subunit delta
VSYAAGVGKARRVRPARELRINRDWCKGCTICVRLCPTGVLGMDGEEKAVVLDIARCTWCRSCELHCPDLAIEILASESAETARAQEKS